MFSPARRALVGRETAASPDPFPALPMPLPRSFGPMLIGAIAIMPVRGTAQQPDTARRAAPPTAAEVQRLPEDSGSVAPGRETPPFHLSGAWWNAHGRVEVTILTPRSLAWLARRDSLAMRVQECFRPGAPRLPGDTLAPQPPRPTPPDVPSVWEAFDSATAGRAFLMMEMDAPVMPAAGCKGADDPVVRAAGIQLVDSGAVPAARNALLTAAATSRGRPLTPVLTARARARLIGLRDPEPRIVPTSLRLYFDPGVVEPDRHGSFAPLVLEVTSADDSRRDSVTVPDQMVTQIWREFLPWRLQRLHGLVSERDLPRLEPPTDTALRRAAALYASGHAVRAADLAASWREQVDPRRRSATDARFADLLLGSVFLAGNDSASARGAYATALAGAPCLHLAAHPEFDRALDAVRPSGARCRWVGSGRQIAWGLGFPGGGQWVHGDRVGGTLASAITVGLAALAIQRNAQAHDQYRAYQAAVPPAAVPAMLDQANATKRAARSFAISAAGVWLASAVVGVVTEAWHAHRVRREQHYEPHGVNAGAHR